MSEPRPHPGLWRRMLQLPARTRLRYLLYYTSAGAARVIHGATHLVNLGKLRWYGVRWGRGLRTWGGLTLDIHPESTVTLGEDVSIVSDSRRSSSAAVYARTRIRTFSPSSQVVIGSRTGLNGTSLTARSHRILIGEGTMVAPNVIILDSDFHIPWPPEQRNRYPGSEQDADVVIGKNCWIGIGTLILKGVTIGENSVIAAGSVVAGDIPPNCLAGGVPARVMRHYLQPAGREGEG